MKNPRKLSEEIRLRLIKQFNQLPSDALIDQRMLASIRGCSLATVELDRLCGRGVSYVRCGRSIRYRKQSVIDWLKAREFNSTSQYQTGGTV